MEKYFTIADTIKIAVPQQYPISLLLVSGIAFS